jgi:ABC-type polysaccharide/polyol phosphate export permease
MAGGESSSTKISLEFTPTWIIVAVCFVTVIISLIFERLLHHGGKISVINFTCMQIVGVGNAYGYG